MVLNRGSCDWPGRSMMKTRSSGMFSARVALSAVSRSGVQVNSALQPEDLSWCSSSVAEYIAFAGVTMPDRRWTANVDIR